MRRDVAAEVRRELGHLRCERTHGSDVGVGTRQRPQHDVVRRRARGHQRAQGQRRIRVARLIGPQTQGLGVLHQRLRAGSAARGDEKLTHAQHGREDLQMHAGLHARAHDQHRSIQAGRQQARGQHGNGRGAPRRHRGAVQNDPARAGGHVEYRHIALDGGQRAARIGRRQGDQLGHRHLAVGGGHDEEHGAVGGGHHDAFGHLDGGRLQQGLDFIDQRSPGQASVGAFGVKCVRHRRPVSGGGC